MNYKSRFHQSCKMLNLKFTICKVVLIGCILFFAQDVCFAQADLVEKALILKDYTQAIEIAEESLNKTVQDKDKILLMLGEAYIGVSNLAKARETFRSIYREYPSSSYAKSAVLRIADSYYLESNYAQAKKLYNYFLTKYGNDKNFLPYVYLKLAYCEEKACYSGRGYTDDGETWYCDCYYSHW